MFFQKRNIRQEEKTNTCTHRYVGPQIHTLRQQDLRMLIEISSYITISVLMLCPLICSVGYTFVIHGV
jgi:hypothetical protein